MNKLTILLSFLALGFLTIMGIANPDASAVWLSSQSQPMDYLRIGMMALLLSLLLTTPPRNKVMRYIVGMISIAIIGVSGYGIYENAMQLFDGIALLSAGISALVATLEVTIIQEKKIKKKTVSYKHLAPAA